MCSSFANKKKVYEGKAKVLFEGPKPDFLVQYFKDDITAFNNTKRAVISGKGVLNNLISSHLMTLLESIGIKTHFVKFLNMREQLVRRVEIIPLELVVRNFAAGGIIKRLGLKEGQQLPEPIVELYYKSDELGDPLITEEHALSFEFLSAWELDDVKRLALRVNDFLSGLFLGVGIRLADFKLEFGRCCIADNMKIVVADEISPDSCRLWDIKTNVKMDKDVFRYDLGVVASAYLEVAKRLCVLE